MNVKERGIYLGVIVLLVLGLSAGAWYFQGATVDGRSAHEALTQLQAEVERLRQPQSAPPQQAQQPPQPGPSGPTSKLTESEERELKELGLKNPAADLVASLEKRTDLVPAGGVLGGTMSYRGSDRWVITRHWVFADADDGHIAVQVLLRYEVKPGGQISWEILDWKRM